MTAARACPRSDEWVSREAATEFAEVLGRKASVFASPYECAEGHWHVVMVA